MKITSYGAAETVTGSRHLLSTSGGQLLLDCGMFQGVRSEANERNQHLPPEIVAAHAMILSHAHIDHSGALPSLAKAGFRKFIYATPATYDLTKIMLMDSAHIQEADSAYLLSKGQQVTPIYTTRDAEEVLRLFQPVRYGEWFSPLPGVRAKFHDAGHILGSAQIEFELEGKGGRVTRFGFTGDLGRKNLPILRDPAQMTNLDVLMTESTYAGRHHDDIMEAADKLAEIVMRTVQRGGKIIIPAFSVERTQEIVYILHQLFDTGKIPVNLPVYVDSPLAVNATEIFRRHRECWDTETYAAFIDKNEGPFTFGGVTYTHTADESKRLSANDFPAIIISASGMCEAGRILHHLKSNIENPANTVLIVGFQAQNTLGRKLVDELPVVNIFGKPYHRNAEVAVLNEFSGHADDSELYANAKGSGAKKIICVHGESDAVTTLAGEFRERLHVEAVVQREGIATDI